MENIDLKKAFEWFNGTIGKCVKESILSFFETNFSIFMSSINTFENIKEDPFLKGEKFYTCQVSIKNNQHVIIRTSSEFIRIIFHNIFGSSYPVFELEKMTNLEQKILNGFFEYMVKGIEKFLIKETEPMKIDPLNKSMLNMVFLIKNTGKICVTLPQNRIIPDLVKLEDNFEFDDFINNFAYVDIITGQSKISLDDLKSLDKDDILILDKSNVKTMTLKTPTLIREIKVNPEPSIMIDMENEENDEYEDSYMSEDNKTMWDDIQIEVSAEFKRVKMTLGELKQISKGLVIDLGSVMNNQISLLVENKTVAKGELVIINDKYGVRVTDVFASKKEENKEAQKTQQPKAQPQAKQAQPSVPPQKPIPQRPQAKQAQPSVPPSRPIPQKPAPKPAAPAPEEQNDEDFDYSNFEE